MCLTVRLSAYPFSLILNESLLLFMASFVRCLKDFINVAYEAVYKKKLCLN